MIDQILKDAQKRMQKALESLKHELGKLRTGRAHPGLLDHLMVPYYGTNTPLSQVANVAATDSRTLTITPWEKAMVAPIEKAIMTSGLGLNPMTAGLVIRVPLPPLTEERRKELMKLVRHEGENARVAVRNVRREMNSQLKEGLKDKELSEDEEKRAQDKVQQVTDQHIKLVDEIVIEKEKELSSV